MSWLSEQIIKMSDRQFEHLKKTGWTFFRPCDPSESWVMKQGLQGIKGVTRYVGGDVLFLDAEWCERERNNVKDI